MFSLTFRLLEADAYSFFTYKLDPCILKSRYNTQNIVVDWYVRTSLKISDCLTRNVRFSSKLCLAPAQHSPRATALFNCEVLAGQGKLSD